MFKIKDRTHFITVLVVFITCIITAILQGSSFYNLSHSTKVTTFVIISIVYALCIIAFAVGKRLNDDNIVIFIVLGAMLIRGTYVLLSGIDARQHDTGYYLGYDSATINPGHLGYIEFIYKFKRIPDFDPYLYFGYFHPPLHHIIAAVWLTLQRALHVVEEQAFENLQILTMCYSGLSITALYRIFKELKISGKGLCIGLSFMALHPALIIMAGSVNNDMLTIFLSVLIVYYGLRWIREPDSWGAIIKVALAIGFGMLAKFNSSMMAFPVGLVFLLHLINKFKTKDGKEIWGIIKKYLVFAAIVAPMGFCWILRNYINWHRLPSVDSNGADSVLYMKMYSLWERFGIPAFSDWRFEFPFHPFSAASCHNVWVIMFQTGLFAEEYPTDLEGFWLVAACVAFVLSLVLAAITFVLLFKAFLDKRNSLWERIYLTSGYVLTIIFYILFQRVYPFTCSADFRYIVITLLYIALTLGLSNKYYGDKWYMKVINILMIAFMALITLVYQFWGCW